MKWESKYYLFFLIFCLAAIPTFQEFLPLSENAESIFYYEIVGNGQVNHNGFGFDSKFNLHITKKEEFKYLINITNPAGKVGSIEWSKETLNALEQPFYILLNTTRTPIGIEYDFEVETNYTIAQKELILKQMQEIYKEYINYSHLDNKNSNVTQSIDNMPFGSCETKVNVFVSTVYVNIEYEATASDCKGNIDPLYKLDMESVHVYPQSEFRKTFAFTTTDFLFQYVRLDARLKLKTEPETDVDIYSLFTFKGMKSLIEEEE